MLFCEPGALYPSSSELSSPDTFRRFLPTKTSLSTASSRIVSWVTISNNFPFSDSIIILITLWPFFPLTLTIRLPSSNVESSCSTVL